MMVACFGVLGTGRPADAYDAGLFGGFEQGAVQMMLMMLADLGLLGERLSS